MYNKLSIVILALATANVCHAQTTKVAETLNDPLKKYVRPSLTVIYYDRQGDALSKRVVSELESRGVPGKFNDNGVYTMSGKEALSDTTAKALIDKEGIAKTIVGKWFPYDADKGEFSMSVIQERGMYSATDQDVVAARATKRGASVLIDAGQALVGRSYIIVYDIFGVKRVDECDKNNNCVIGYEASIALHLFKLAGDTVIMETLYNNWNDAQAINKMDVKVKHIASLKGGTPMIPAAYDPSTLNEIRHTQSKENPPVSDETQFNLFVGKLTDIADIRLTKVNEDFKVKAPIYKTSPIRAKIGLKEGVKTDQRYYVFETTADESGNVKPVRRGVVRATNHVSPNNVVATGEGDSITIQVVKGNDTIAKKVSSSTIFYQTLGRRLDEGFMMQQTPDYGVNVAATVGTDFNVLVQLNLIRYATDFMPNLVDMLSIVPYGTKLYIGVQVPFLAQAGVDKFTIEGQEMTAPSGKKFYLQPKGAEISSNIFEPAATMFLLNFGLSKDFYFARRMALTPYLGVALLFSNAPADESGTEIEQYNYAVFAAAGSSIGLDLGVLYTFGVTPWLQVIGNAGFSSAKLNYIEGGGLSVGAGLRFEF